MDKKQKWKRQIPLHLMILPALIILIIFCYIPMFGIVIAFQNYFPILGISGSPFVGLNNFRFMFQLPETMSVLSNTLSIAIQKIVFGFTVPIIVSLLLNEVRKNYIRSTIQTFIYLPYFFSWVILAGILVDILSLNGIINNFMSLFGIDSVFFLGSNTWFQPVIVISDIWKNFGFGTVVYLAAIVSISPTLYESARIDGANRWKQAIHITLPGMLPIIILLATLSLGNVLNAGFEQIFNLYNPAVYRTGDIIDTFVFRLGLVDMRFGLATAVGLMRSVVSLLLISTSYFLAYKFADYRIF